MSALVVFKAAPGSYYSDPELLITPSGPPPMLAPLQSSNQSSGPMSPSGRCRAWLDGVVQRRPFVTLFLLVFLSNIVGSFFNVEYNRRLIVQYLMDEHQRDAFRHVALPVYNAIAYPVGIGLMIWLLVPLARCRKHLRASRPVSPAELELCRRRLVNLPFYQVCINFLGWLPGAVAFPLLVCGLGGNHEAAAIWIQFILSFLVSALLTTAQTFFILETYLTAYFYPDFFRDARPAEARGVIRIPFGLRLLLLWSAVAVPLLALLLVAWNFGSHKGDRSDLQQLAVFVAVVGGASGAGIFWLVGRDVYRWVAAHASAAEQIEMGNLDVHVEQLRPDEWGQLTDRFNDMVSALGRARQMRETFGQFVSPEIRDDILQNYPGLDVALEDVTVLFADIRGFTRRTAGLEPTEVVYLLNRFLTLAVSAVEPKGGLVNKFLGDGVMALFGVRREKVHHADQAVIAAQELLAQLNRLNAELVADGKEPLKIGIGIHSGPALIGCFGSKIKTADGRERMRREFTAIGETVNLAQRLEQLTKCCAGPILLSEQTRCRLKTSWTLRCHGPLQVPGYDGNLVVYQVSDQ
jgi:adenylate cyclase